MRGLQTAPEHLLAQLQVALLFAELYITSPKRSGSRRLVLRMCS